jgi:hypothetical protein
VAKATSKLKTKKRQPTKKRLPSSSAKKTVAKTKAKKPVKEKAKIAAKKNPAVKKPAKAAAKTKPVKKPVVKKARKVAAKKVRKSHTKKLNIRLGRNTSLVLTFKLSKKTPAKKHKIRRKKRISLSFEQNLLLSLATMTAGFLGSVYAGSQIFSAPLGADSSSVSAQEAPVEPIAPEKQFLPKSAPAHLRVPAVEIDTSVDTVGKNPNGTLEVPEDYKIAGWYRFGPTPGEQGPSIMVGHVDNHKGLGVFWRLRELKPGQIIEVKRKDGKIAKFKVGSVKQFPQNSFPTEQVYGNIDHAGLRLITCGGNFSYITQRYSENTVVFASLSK